MLVERFLENDKYPTNTHRNEEFNTFFLQATFSFEALWHQQSTFLQSRGLNTRRCGSD